jgi:hypothetical protein
MGKPFDEAWILLKESDNDRFCMQCNSPLKPLGSMGMHNKKGLCEECMQIATPSSPFNNMSPQMGSN